MMTNGVGAIIGGYASGAVVDAFSVYAEGGGLHLTLLLSYPSTLCQSM